MEDRLLIDIGDCCVQSLNCLPQCSLTWLVFDESAAMRSIANFFSQILPNCWRTANFNHLFLTLFVVAEVSKVIWQRAASLPHTHPCNFAIPNVEPIELQYTSLDSPALETMVVFFWGGGHMSYIQ